MKIISKFDYSHVLYSKNHNLNLLVQAIAPKVAVQESRKQLNLITAIDTSGSMGGDKMEYAKKSLLKLIDHLGPTDTLGVLEFTGHVSVVSESIKMTADNKAQLKAKVMKLHAQSATNFSGALFKALEMAEKVDGDVRIIMFTDGQPTAGITATDQIIAALDSKIRKGVSITSFGYGSDHDSTFLTDLSKFGNGNYAYVENPDNALAAFAIELGGLLSCYGQDLKFTIKPKGSVTIKEVISDLDVEEKDGGVVISVPDIYSEEAKNIVLEVSVPEQEKYFPRATTLVSVEVSYIEAATGNRAKMDVTGKVTFVKTEESQKIDKDVADQLAIARLVQAQTQATVFAQAGNFDAAQMTMRGVSTYFDQASADVKGAHGVASSYFVSSSAYQSNMHNSNSMRSALRSGRAGGSSAGGMGMAGGATFSLNSAQKTMVSSFVDPNQGITGSPIGVAGQGSTLTGSAGAGHCGGPGTQDNIGVTQLLNTVASTDKKKKLSKSKSKKEW